MPKILVVDDSRLTRRVVVGALQKAGYECVEAGDGAEALEAFGREAPDCVFSDLLMPRMDGFELTARLRDLAPEVPVIIATADIQDSSRERCLEAGVVRLLNKPLKADEIASAVAEALAGAAQPTEV